jgi:hypothetical protein
MSVNINQSNLIDYSIQASDIRQRAIKMRDKKKQEAKMRDKNKKQETRNKGRNMIEQKSTASRSRLLQKLFHGVDSPTFAVRS